MKIQIFLASSINEFSTERRRAVDFVELLNEKLKAHRLEYTLNLVICEDLPPFLAQNTIKQAEYDEVIKNSDLLLVIVGKHCGKVTVHEFDVAYEKQKDGNLPRIAVYIEHDENGKPRIEEGEAKEFEKKLREELGHYYGRYLNIEDALFKIIINTIALLGDDGKKMFVIKNNELFISGEKSPVLSLKNIPAWGTNDALLQAQKNLDKLQKQYMELQVEWMKEDHDESIDREYKTVVAGFEEKREAIKKLRLSIFDDLCLASKAIMVGGLTDRQACAYRLMDEGKWKEANAILDFDVIKSDIKHLYDIKAKNDELKSAIIENEEKVRTEAQGKLDELKLKIGIAKSLVRTIDDWDKIELYYREAVELARSFDLNKIILLNYAVFIFSRAGTHDKEKTKQAEELFNEIILMARLRDNKEVLAFALNRMGYIYYDRKKYIDSQNIHCEALSIYRILADENANYLSDVAETLCDLAHLHDCYLYKLDDVEREYNEALSIYQRIAVDNWAQSSKVAEVLVYLGSLFKKTNKIDLAEQKYFDALKIYRELFVIAPEENLEGLSKAVDGIVDAFIEKKFHKKAIELCCESIDSFRLNMPQDSSRIYQKKIANLLRKVARIYSDISFYDQATNSYQEAIIILEGLAKTYPDSDYFREIENIQENLRLIENDKKLEFQSPKELAFNRLTRMINDLDLGSEDSAWWIEGRIRFIRKELEKSNADGEKNEGLRQELEKREHQYKLLMEIELKKNQKIKKQQNQHITNGIRSAAHSGGSGFPFA